MKVIDAGHTYELQGNKGTGPTILRFYMDPRIHDGREQEGTTNQEVARAMIDRLQYLEREALWGGDFHMIDNLRDLIIMHEVRAATRKGLCSIEAMRWLTKLRGRHQLEPGIEVVKPRPEDGHIYPQDIHLASRCLGRCDANYERENFHAPAASAD